MENFIIIAVILGIVAGIIFYLYKAKKSGQACVGCPYCKQCGGNCNAKTKN